MRGVSGWLLSLLRCKEIKLLFSYFRILSRMLGKKGGSGMPRNPKRRVVVQYGTIPLERLLESAEPAACCDAVIRDEQRDLAVCAFRGADHAAAFQAAELDRLEVDDAEDLFAD